jgi:hypothetical protein
VGRGGIAGSHTTLESFNIFDIHKPLGSIRKEIYKTKTIRLQFLYGEMRPKTRELARTGVLPSLAGKVRGKMCDFFSDELVLTSTLAIPAVSDPVIY